MPVLPRVWVCLRLRAGDNSGVRGCSRQPGSFVSPWERIGLALAPYALPGRHKRTRLPGASPDTAIIPGPKPQAYRTHGRTGITGFRLIAETMQPGLKHARDCTGYASKLGTC